MKRTVYGNLESRWFKPLISNHPIVEGRYQHGTRATGILFRNAISRATVREHAIARVMEQQFARSLAGRFRTTRWSVVSLSARVAAEGRVVP
jgi:hypothetical protein